MADKAWYWLALGLLALGLNHAIVTGRLDLGRNLADRALAQGDRLSANAVRYLAFAQASVGLRSVQLSRVQPVMTRVQANLACAQATIARRQADMALRQAGIMRLQRDQVRSMVIERMRLPRRVEIAPPAPPAIPDDDTI